MALVIFVLIAQFVGFLGSVFTVNSVKTWYLGINKPSWNPPGWLFGPVWFVLYTLMGIASYLVWQERDKKGARQALTIYGGHLLFNILWSVLFFELKNPGLAFGEILLLLVIIVVVMKLFYRIRRETFWLLLPYLLWVSFAAFLNFTIWRLNS